MAFMSIQNNTTAQYVNTQLNYNIDQLDQSIKRLSTGLRINSAADDPSGLVIADSLRSQASSMGQAYRNANEAVSMLQLADEAMAEQIDILTSIKTKAIEAAQSSLSSDSRLSIQEEISAMLEELDNIAYTTQYNGYKLLSGSFYAKDFQIGAYSNETINATIQATQSAKIGHSRFETGTSITASVVATTPTLTVGSKTYTYQSVVISNSSGTGIGELANVINMNSDETGVKASYKVELTGNSAITAGTYNLTLNGTSITGITVLSSDSDAALTTAINAETTNTGVEASIDSSGQLVLTTSDGRGISISGVASINEEHYGRLTLTRLDPLDITVSGGFTNAGFAGNESEVTLNLLKITGTFNSADADAFGAFGMSGLAESLGAGVTTMAGAQAVIDIAESAQTQLDKIRASIGSIQNQFTSQANYLAQAQVDVQSSESTIRDIDFAAETANFTKQNVLVQSGSFAMTQANVKQEMVLQLLA